MNQFYNDLKKLIKKTLGNYYTDNNYFSNIVRVQLFRYKSWHIGCLVTLLKLCKINLTHY
jgi:hypothetical protein